MYCCVVHPWFFQDPVLPQKLRQRAGPLEVRAAEGVCMSGPGFLFVAFVGAVLLAVVAALGYSTLRTDSKF